MHSWNQLNRPITKVMGCITAMCSYISSEVQIRLGFREVCSYSGVEFLLKQKSPFTLTLWPALTNDNLNIWFLYRKKRRSSWQPVKGAMRQRKFFWSILPIARSPIILTSCPEILPRNACTMTLCVFWMNTMWSGVLGFIVHP